MSINDLAVKTIKGLAMDAVQAANSGHPGMPMGMADTATVLWSRFLKFDPDDPNWPDRDRFVLSAGHGSMLLYALLHLSGYEDMTLEQLKNFRQWGSKTAGHPEYGFAGGIETTTGPLGQGFGNAVGMAMAERLLAGRFNQPGRTIMDHYTYVIAGDGDLMEGVSAEAASLAGHLGLGKLIVLYDDNGITIDGGTDLTFTEDVGARFDAYGWHTAQVDGHDHESVAQAIEGAQAVTDRPSLIACRTHIGHGAPTKQDSSAAHGAPLGVDEIRATKEAMGWPTNETFTIPPEVRTFFGHAAERGGAHRKAWSEARDSLDASARQELDEMLSGRVVAAAWDALPSFETGASIATRKASAAVLNALSTVVPGLIGGSADLAGSNGTTLKDYDAITRDGFSPRHRNIHFGVREHGMGAILNGMSLHGGFHPYGGTFLIFSDYMRPSIRLAGLMHQPVTYVFTHDSVFLGEDGPTHQPVEQAMSLRLIPNVVVVRPADANETAAAWRIALGRDDGPTALLLTRQGLPVLEEADHDGVLRGGYVMRREESAAGPDVILLATGSEVSLALETATQLGPNTRVVSMPSFELFDQQEEAYRNQVLPPSVRHRVAVEAGSTTGWERYVGDDGLSVGIDRFGMSAPTNRITEKFNFRPDALTATIQEYLRS